MTCRYPEGAAQVPFEIIRASLRNWRRLVFPPAPANILEFAARLANAQNAVFLQYNSGKLSTVMLRDANNDIHVCIFYVNFLTHVQEDITVYQIYSTYQTTPEVEGVMQLCTLMGIYHELLFIIFKYVFFSFYLFFFLSFLLIFSDVFSLCQSMYLTKSLICGCSWQFP